MAGNGRFELSSASPDSSTVGNYPNGQRGNCLGPSLDRSGSFRESNENRMFSTGKGASRGFNTSLVDLPPLSQCLMLEPITICDQKFSKTGELRRALDFSVSNNSEDNIVGASHLKASALAAMDEIKRFRASVADTCGKASGRAKKLDEHLHKLNKYTEASTSKKQQHNELLSNERPGASGFKIGAHVHRSPSEFVSQKVEERPKNVILNKRVRTSVAETRAEFRNNGQPRQPLLIKERDMPKDNNADIDVAEEKIRRLPAGGDSWDKRMKKKRSIGAVGSRASDGDTDMKRPTLHKNSSEPGLQSCDSMGLRVLGPVGTGAAIKVDGALPAGSNVRAAPKKEQEKSILSRDVASGLNKDRLLPKSSFKLSIREDLPNAVAKGKTPHRGISATTSVVSNVPSVSATLNSWELPPTTNKNPSISGANYRKRSVPTGSSSAPIAKWGGQRPQKISRTRRTNLVSPVSNHDEGQMSSEGRSPDFGAKLITTGANGSPLSKSASSGSQINKVKPETVHSPARLSESDDSSARESKFKDKGTGISETEERVITLSSVGAQTNISKSKFLHKEENPDGVRRQGRSGRVTSVSRVSISPVREKLDIGTVNKPLRPIKSTSDKNGSKTGRPSKKLSDRKGFSRLGLASGGSPDWDSEDDREELSSAANMAYNSNLKACSSLFWRKVESVFTSIGSEEKSYLAEQLRLADDYCSSFSQMLSQGDDVKGGLLVEEISVPEALSDETNPHIQNRLGKEDLGSKSELVNQFQSSISPAGTDSGQTFDITIPLYQRVLSALITDGEEFAETGIGSDEMHQDTLWNSPIETHYNFDSESNLRERLEFEHESVLGVQVPKNGTTNRFVGCNGYANYSRYPNISDHSCNGGSFKGDSEKEHSNDDENSCSTSSFDCQYEQMPFEEKLLLELRSVGLYPETVPDLHDKDEDEIYEEITQLQRKLHQQTAGKKMSLDKMHKAIQGQDNCRGDLEHVALNKLVELAYKEKLLATKGNLAIKNGIPKVSRQVALAFARRTLSRCRRYEDSGVSCFNEPALRDIISAVPPRVHIEDPSASVRKTLANGDFSGTGVSDGFENSGQKTDHAFAKSGPITNKGKMKEVLLDDFLGDSAFRSNPGCSLSGGAKGKRSNGFAKAGGRSLVNAKGDRKTKLKHAQRTAQLSTSGNRHVTPPMYAPVCGSGETIDNNNNKRRDAGLASSAPESSKDKNGSGSTNLPLNNSDTIDDLGVGSDLVPPQDLNSWFNFDIDGIQEDHDAVGLEIPMDDLSELMF